MQEPSHFCWGSLEFKYCLQYQAVDTEEGERKEDCALRKTSGMRKNETLRLLVILSIGYPLAPLQGSTDPSLGVLVFWTDAGRRDQSR